MSVSTDAVAHLLLNRFGPTSVLLGEDVRERPVSKQIVSGCEALALLRPADTQELASMVRFCVEHELPMVPRAGMTGLVGGTVTSPDEVSLSLERMNRVVSVDRDAQTAVVQAGTPLQAIHEAVQAHGMQFPLDLGARGSATIGGMLSTNAGGNKVLRYGMTRDLVLGLEVVLPDGQIMNSMYRLLKNNTGLDLKQLYIGTEGTLGIITQAVLRLFPSTDDRHAALCAFESFDAMVQMLNLMRAHAGPALSSYEVMWNAYYALVTQPGRLRAPLSRDYPLYALIECEYPAQGRSAQNGERFAQTLQTAMEQGLVIDAVIAQSESERGALWRLRDEVHYIRTLSPIYTFDVSLPIGQMQAYLRSLRSELRARWPDAVFIVYGHVGDGNLHLAISCGGKEDDHTIEQLVYEPLAAIGGSVSAEHGIGLYKKPYLQFSRNPVELAVMRSVKAALDPKNLMNPGKIL
ncbi:FAD-binding oxidoreductase [Bordetella sp. 15P40C-2]|uniref:FAD-binding oxidoreductase n=1 Tax=Bordetella sp. 15P40C-2 TaxID=2572246 RepID=UPI001328627E|nr:FAD-binding oxidoreductase [Bordetella sp. 15P40C-2]MVW72818.1 FAD-binding protein [Bordetella sp. 15P40C-2]